MLVETFITGQTQKNTVEFSKENDVHQVKLTAYFDSMVNLQNYCSLSTNKNNPLVENRNDLLKNKIEQEGVEYTITHAIHEE